MEDQDPIEESDSPINYLRKLTNWKAQNTDKNCLKRTQLLHNKTSRNYKNKLTS